MEKLNINNFQIIKPFFDKYGYNEYNCNIITLLMWNHVYEFYYEIRNGYLVGYWNYHGKNRWIMPMCDDMNLKEAIDYMIDYSKKNKQEFMIEASIEEFNNKLRLNGFDMLYVCEGDAGDYIYDASMHRTLVGKKMQKRRNHYNYFIKNYDNYYLKKYDKTLYEDVIFFLEDWKQNKASAKEQINDEIKGIMLLLENYTVLNINIRLLYVNDKVEGLSINSQLTTDTMQIHVEKANHDIRGIYVVLLKLVLEEFNNYLYINREDDLGIEFLRKAKMDLHPVNKLKKYAVILNNYDIKKATLEDMETIKDLWLEYFEEETAKSTDFYFNELYDQDNTYLLKINEQIVSVVQAKPVRLYFDELIKSHFILGVLTLKQYQGNGLMKVLMKHVLNEIKDDKVVILQAYNYNIYQSLGFDHYYYLSNNTVEGLKEDTDTELIENYQPNDLLNIYKDYTSDKYGYLIRDLDYYVNFFVKYHSNENNTISVFTNNNKLGYAVYSMTDDLIFVYELCSSYNMDIICKLSKMYPNHIINYKVAICENDNNLERNMAIKFNDMALKAKFDANICFINEIL